MSLALPTRSLLAACACVMTLVLAMPAQAGCGSYVRILNAPDGAAADLQHAPAGPDGTPRCESPQVPMLPGGGASFPVSPISHLDAILDALAASPPVATNRAQVHESASTWSLAQDLFRPPR